MNAEREERAQEIRASLAVEVALQSREDAWELARLEPEAVEGVDDAEAREQALTAARAGWYAERQDQEEAARLEVELEAKLTQRVKQMTERREAKLRVEARKLYGSGGAGGIGGPAWWTRPSEPAHEPTR